MEYETTNPPLPDMKEVYNNLQVALGEENFKQYKSLMKTYFTGMSTKIKFDEDAKKILTSLEHIRLHNSFMLSLSSKICSNNHSEVYDEKVKNLKYPTQEMCLPSEDMIRDRFLVTAFDYEMDGVDDAVIKMTTLATQVFAKNIITGMVSRSRGYKIRENNFQHSIGMPAPNPWLRNTNRIIDSKQEPNVAVNKLAHLEPIIDNDLDTAEQQTAFNVACSTSATVNASASTSPTHTLTLQCLYDTLRENPSVVNNHNLLILNLERIIAKLDCSE